VVAATAAAVARGGTDPAPAGRIVDLVAVAGRRCVEHHRRGSVAREPRTVVVGDALGDGARHRLALPRELGHLLVVDLAERDLEALPVARLVGVHDGKPRVEALVDGGLRGVSGAGGKPEAREGGEGQERGAGHGSGLQRRTLGKTIRRPSGGSQS